MARSADAMLTDAKSAVAPRHNSPAGFALAQKADRSPAGTISSDCRSSLIFSASSRPLTVNPVIVRSIVRYPEHQPGQRQRQEVFGSLAVRVQALALGSEYTDELWREIQRLPEFRLALAQRLRQFLVLGHIDRGSHEP